MPAFAEILRASKDNDFRSLALILLEDASSARASNKIGQTGLHVAAIWGNVEVSKLLLEARADVNAQNQFGLTPLHGAAQGDHIACAQLLVDAGANTRISSGNGMLASDAAKSDAMRLICGASALKGHAALAAGVSALEELLDQGDCDLSDQDSDGNTILHLAVENALNDDGDDPRTYPPLDLLLKRHLSAKGFAQAQCLRNDRGLMPLHIAAGAGCLAICRALLQASAPTGLVNSVAFFKDKQYSGQWGKKNAEGKIERLPSADKTALHFIVQVLHDAAEYAEDEGEECEYEDEERGDQPRPIFARAGSRSERGRSSDADSPPHRHHGRAS